MIGKAHEISVLKHLYQLNVFLIILADDSTDYVDWWSNARFLQSKSICLLSIGPLQPDFASNTWAQFLAQDTPPFASPIFNECAKFDGDMNDFRAVGGRSWVI